MACLSSFFIFFSSSSLALSVEAGYYGRLPLRCTQMRTKVKSKEKSLSQLIEQSLNEIYIFDIDTLKFVYTNKATRLNLGYSSEELQEMTPLDLKTQYTNASFRKLISPLIKNHDPRAKIVFETFHKRKDETSYPVEVHFQLTDYNNKPMCAAFILDISDRKQIEEELRKSEEQYRNLYAKTPVMLHSIDSETRLVSVSEQWLNVLGYREEEVLGAEVTDFMTEASRKYAIETVIPELFAAGSVTDISCQFVKKNGEVIDALISAITEKDSSGKIARTMSVLNDITERKKHEKELSRFRSALDASPDSIYFTDYDSMRFLYANKGAAIRTGYTQDELLKMGPEDILTFDRQELRNMYDEAIAAGEAGTFMQVESVLKGGAHSWSELRRHALQLDDHWIIITISHDITVRKQQEEELLQFRAAMDASPDMIYVTDRDSMRFIYTNKMAAELTGYSQEELLQMGPEDILRVERPDLERMYDEVIAAGEAGVVTEVKSRTKDGVRSVAEVRRRALQINDRWIIITISQDISTRKRAEQELQEIHQDLEHRVNVRTRQLQLEIEQRKEIAKNLKLSEERFYDIATSSADGFWETDSDLAFTYIDKSFFKMTGIDPEHYLGLTHRELNRDFVDTPEWKKYLGELEKHTPFRDFQFKHKRPDDSYLYISISGTPVFNVKGEFKGYRGAGSDVTVQVESEQRAAEAQEKMREAKEEAEKASKAKSEFLASMSHELRTPMNSILGFAELLELSDTESKFTEKQTNYIQHLLSSSRHLLNLITDVLELNAIEEGRMSLKMDRVSTRKVVENCLNQVSLKAEEKNIQLLDQCKAQESLPRLWTDATRLQQVLLNLLNNAIKYNREGGSVTISCCEVPNNMLRISVADTGVGIPADRREHLFLPFERLGRESGQIEGTGIGLTIAKRIVEMLDGKIGFETEEDQGSTFWVDIPLDPKKGSAKAGTESATGEDAITPDENGPPPTLLYIEDNRDNVCLMEDIVALLSPDVRMLVAYDAKLGIELAKKYLPDLILMDINLPGISGTQALQELRQRPETRSIPTIAISADAMPADIEKAMSAGFEDYITKPFKVMEIQQIISKFLNL